MTTLYLVRHAESMANLNGIFAGHYDAKLSPKGEGQAEALGCFIAENCPVDKIYSSDLSRTMATAKPAADKLGLEIIPDKELREIFAGDWDGKSIQDIIENHSGDFETWRHNFSEARCSGGESVAEVYFRITNCINRILEENEGKNILILSHGAAIRAFTAYAMCFPANRIDRAKFSRNSAISVFTFHENRYAPLKLGSIEHLEGKDESLMPKNPKDCY